MIGAKPGLRSDQGIDFIEIKPAAASGVGGFPARPTLRSRLRMRQIKFRA